MKRILAFALPAGSFLVGWAAWNTIDGALVLSLLLPVLWAQSPNRLIAAGIAVAYYFGAGLDVPAGAGVFFGDKPMIFGWLLLTGVALVNAIPWAFMWRADPHGWRAVAAVALTAIPPIGIIGWANPLTAAGIVFTSTGWAGLIGVALIIAYSTRMPFLSTGIAASGVLIGLFFGPALAGQEEWMGIDTQLPGGRGDMDLVQTYLDTQHLQQLARTSESDVLILPETVGGLVSASIKLWSDEQRKMSLEGRTVIVGMTQREAGSNRYDNVMVAIGAKEGILYKQRVPVPVSMWKPFSGDGANAYWFENPVVSIHGRRVGFLVCYEQLLVWPVIHSIASGAQVLVAPGNAWWARDTKIPEIQHRAVNAWGRLFSVPVIAAFND